MAKIKASLADVSTEFQPVEPGIYELEVAKVDEVEKQGEFVAYRIQSKIITPGDSQNRTISDYIHLKKPGEEIDPEAIGLKTIRRYFEVTHGEDEVKTWTDDDFDTDLLVGKTFQAQVAIDSYTPEGQTEPRKNNKFKRMEPVG